MGIHTNPQMGNNNQIARLNFNRETNNALESDTLRSIGDGEEWAIDSPFNTRKRKEKRKKQKLLPTDGRQNFQLEAKKPKKGVARFEQPTATAENKESSAAGSDKASATSSGYSFSTLTGSGVALSILAIIDAMNAQLEAGVYKREQSLSMMDAQFSAGMSTSELVRSSAKKERNMLHMDAGKQFASGGIGALTTGYSIYQSNSMRTETNQLNDKIKHQKAHREEFEKIGAEIEIAKDRPTLTKDAQYFQEENQLVSGTHPHLDADPSTPLKDGGTQGGDLQEKFRHIQSSDARKEVFDNIDKNIKSYEDRVNSLASSLNATTNMANMVQQLVSSFTGGALDFAKGDIALEKGKIDASKVMSELSMRVAGESLQQHMQSAPENDRQAQESLSLLRQMQQANEVRG